MVTALLAPASQGISSGAVNISMPILVPAHLQGIMESGAIQAGRSSLDVTALQLHLLYKGPGGEGAVLLRPGRSAPCQI